MKKHKRNCIVVFSALTLMVLSSEQARAQNVNCLEGIQYGELIPCGAANAVTIRPDNTRVLGGCMTASGAPFSRARCTVTQGFPFRPIQISITPATATMSTTGANTMTVSSIQIVTNAGGSTTTISPGPAFTSIPIGATLNVGASQAAGSYSGTMTFNAVLQ